MVIGIPTYGNVQHIQIFIPLTSGSGWTLRNPQNQTGVGAPATGASSATEYVQSAGTGAYFEVRNWENEKILVSLSSVKC